MKAAIVPIQWPQKGAKGHQIDAASGAVLAFLALFCGLLVLWQQEDQGSKAHAVGKKRLGIIEESEEI
jgi:hypothetical protein